jgi:cysteinyl-tRNA synthetase
VPDAPAEVADLAARRAQARAAREFAAADALRAQITQLGWVVTDGPGGFELSPAPAAAGRLSGAG